MEATREAEQAWLELLLTGLGPLASADCTPGYYNNEGDLDDPRVKYMVGYPLGASAYFDYLDDWRRAGSLAGLLLS